MDLKKTFDFFMFVKVFHGNTCRCFLCTARSIIWKKKKMFRRKQSQLGVYLTSLLQGIGYF